jgi:DNA (cytosine-5)-methyltransferase 1
VRFGSVCSGIEAASVAWHPLGWQAAWLSEIEPFPSAVLAHHYPDVPNLGDMTTLPERILSGEVEAPDLFCGGTPCQAFSVAGLRNSLEDARGNLSLTFVGIANAIDHVRSVRRDDPGIIFWENVPGVLSTKDNAFGCFLGALAGEDEPIIPSGEKWTNAGCVYGPQRAVAWRVLDAQYFGVAQRRRRVFVVASARDDFDPAAVLFEFDGVRRDTAPSREARKVTPTISSSGTGVSRVGFNCEDEWFIETPISARMVSFGEYVDDGTASAMKARDYKDATDLVAQPIAFSRNDDGRDATNDLSPTMRVAGRAGGMLGVAQPISIQDVRPVEKAQNGKGWNDDGTAYTVDTHATQGVAQPINFGAQMSVPQVDFDLCQTLQAKNPMAVAQPIAFQQTADCLTAAYGTKWNGNASATNGSLFAAQPYIGGVDYENNAHTMDQPTGPLLKGSPTGGGRPLPAIATAMMVRRLTPVECERLQGFPDGYTNIPWRKKTESPDGPRYKALGNSWAVPVVAWIGHRIQQELNK